MSHECPVGCQMASDPRRHYIRKNPRIPMERPYVGTPSLNASIRLRSFESSTSPSLCCCCSVPALSQLRQCHSGALTLQFRDRHCDFCDRHRDFRIALATPSPLPRTSVTDCDKHCRSVTCAATVAKFFLSFSRLSLRLSRLSLRLPRPSLAFSHCCRRSLEHP